MMARPKESSPTLPISTVRMPIFFSARPVLATGPPVETTHSPTTVRAPGTMICESERAPVS